MHQLAKVQRAAKALEPGLIQAGDVPIVLRTMKLGRVVRASAELGIGEINA